MPNIRYVWDANNTNTAPLAAALLADGYPVAAIPGSAEWNELLRNLSERLFNLDHAGMIAPYAGEVVPTGWLWCNGAAVSRTTYDDLFAAIGIKWGAGDTTTTFNLPNFINRKPRGAAALAGVGVVGGADTHAQTAAEVGAHNHGYQRTQRDSGTVSITTTSGISDTWYWFDTDTATNTPAGAPMSILDPFGAVNFIIKT